MNEKNNKGIDPTEGYCCLRCILYLKGGMCDVIGISCNVLTVGDEKSISNKSR